MSEAGGLQVWVTECKEFRHSFVCYNRQEYYSIACFWKIQLPFSFCKLFAKAFELTNIADHV